MGDMVTTDTSRPRRGRALDPTRDVAIREAVLAELAAVGYEGLTMDAVAARARAGKGALYRRWPSKAALVIDSISQLRPMAEVPDEGSLAADLVRLATTVAPRDDDRIEVSVMLGLVTAAHRDPELATALRTQLIEPRQEPIRAILERARARGEISSDADVDLIVEVIPAMVMGRAISRGLPPDRDFILQVLRAVVLPALFHGPMGPPPPST
jgi:AcrR family transcriptional regulator